MDRGCNGQLGDAIRILECPHGQRIHGIPTDFPRNADHAAGTGIITDAGIGIIENEFFGRCRGTEDKQEAQCQQDQEYASFHGRDLLCQREGVLCSYAFVSICWLYYIKKERVSQFGPESFGIHDC